MYRTDAVRVAVPASLEPVWQKSEERFGGYFLGWTLLGGCWASEMRQAYSRWLNLRNNGIRNCILLENWNIYMK